MAMSLIEQLLHLPVLIGAALLMGITTLIGVFVYLLSNRLLASSEAKKTGVRLTT